MLTLWLGKCCVNGKVKGCKIILIGDSSGGNLVLGTARWLRDENLLPPPDGLLLLSVRRSYHPPRLCLTPSFPYSKPSCDPCTPRFHLGFNLAVFLTFVISDSSCLPVHDIVVHPPPSRKYRLSRRHPRTPSTTPPHPPRPSPN